MKKLLVFLVIAGLLAGGGYYAYNHLLGGGSRGACIKLADLCGAKEVSADKLSRCQDGLAELEKVAGKEKVKRAVTCIGEAKSCMGGLGCMAGAGAGAAGEFLNGFKNALMGN